MNKFMSILFNLLDKMDKSLEGHNLLTLTTEEIDARVVCICN